MELIQVYLLTIYFTGQYHGDTEHIKENHLYDPHT